MSTKVKTEIAKDPLRKAPFIPNSFYNYVPGNTELEQYNHIVADIMSVISTIQLHSDDFYVSDYEKAIFNDYRNKIVSLGGPLREDIYMRGLDDNNFARFFIKKSPVYPLVPAWAKVNGLALCCYFMDIVLFKQEEFLTSISATTIEHEKIDKLLNMYLENV